MPQLEILPRLLATDLDGTLLPYGAPAVPQETVRALQALQRQGVTVVLATGRGPALVPPSLLGGLVPDAYLLANGICLLDGQRRVLSLPRMEEADVAGPAPVCRGNRNAPGLQLLGWLPRVPRGGGIPRTAESGTRL